jgi:hypothetical protein
MFDWEKSSGVDAPLKKITFLAPGLQGFSRGTRMRSWVLFLITFYAGRINPAAFECRISTLRGQRPGRGQQ